MVESVVSLATFCQFLCMIVVGCFPISEKGVTTGRMLVPKFSVFWDKR